MRGNPIEKLEKVAREDADKEAYLAIRRLTVFTSDLNLSIGLLGPYQIPGHKEVLFYTEVRKGESRLLIPSGGDRFQALSDAVETCRRQIATLLKEHPEGLLGEGGELYLNYDFPHEPTSAPPIDWNHPKRHRD